jgi:hypothetical protein
MFERTRSAGLPLYLEAFHEQNVDFYLARGFEVVRTEPILGGTTTSWSMVWRRRMQSVAVAAPRPFRSRTLTALTAHPADPALGVSPGSAAPRPRVAACSQTAILGRSIPEAASP